MNVSGVFKQQALNGAASILLGDRLWSDVKKFVQDVDGESGLTGQQKKDKVKSDLKVIFGELAEQLLNLAIELAVAYLRATL